MSNTDTTIVAARVSREWADALRQQLAKAGSNYTMASFLTEAVIEHAKRKRVVLPPILTKSQAAELRRFKRSFAKQLRLARNGEAMY